MSDHYGLFNYGDAKGDTKWEKCNGCGYHFALWPNGEVKGHDVLEHKREKCPERHREFVPKPGVRQYVWRKERTSVC